MVEQTTTSILEEIRRAVRDKERELSELDLMLADYHTERSRLIRELRRLRAQLRDAKEIGGRMETDIKHDVHQHQEQSVLASVWYFVRHYIEMCLAMCIGGIPLIFLFFWGAAQLGYPDLVQRFPELSIMVIGIILSLVMTAWMRFRKMSWRLSLEMGSTTILLGIVLVGLSVLGILPSSSQLEWMKVLACPVMLIPMFIRLDHYSGRMDHSMHSMHAMH